VYASDIGNDQAQGLMRVAMQRIVRSVVAVSAFACVLTAADAQAQEKVTLRVSSFLPPQGFLNVAIVQPFLDRVAADSQGTLEFRFFPGGTLGRAAGQQLKLVQEGAADIAVVMPAYTPGAFEAYNVTQLPGVAASTRASAVGAWRAFEAGLLPEPEGVKILGIVPTASNILHVKEPAPTIASLAGRKIRTAGALQLSAMNKLGAAGVGNILGPEIAEALSRNLLDGVLMDWIGIKEFRVDRTAQHHMEVDFGRVAITLPINKQRFDSLPEPAKAALLKHGGLAYAHAGGQAFDDGVKEFRANYAKERGHTAGTFPPSDQEKIDAAFKEVVNEWVGGEAGRDKILDVFRKSAAEVK